MTRPPSPSSPSTDIQDSKIPQKIHKTEITPVSDQADSASPGQIKKVVDAHEQFIPQNEYVETKIMTQEQRVTDNSLDENSLKEENKEIQTTPEEKIQLKQENGIQEIENQTKILENGHDNLENVERNSVLDSDHNLEKKSSKQEMKLNIKSQRNSKEERKFQVGSISTQKQFPTTSKISLLKIFDSPSAGTPKIDDISNRHSPLPQTPKIVEHSRKMGFGSRREKEVLIGTPVKEGHANYVLMYDMLTGIRISVQTFCLFLI